MDVNVSDSVGSLRHIAWAIVVGTRRTEDNSAYVAAINFELLIRRFARVLGIEYSGTNFTEGAVRLMQRMDTHRSILKTTRRFVPYTIILAT